MQVQLIDREPVRVAYLRHTGPYGQAINDFWLQRFVPFAQAHGLLGAARYGISHDDPSITAPAQCRYDAAVEVPASLVPTHGALITTLPGGRYARTAYSGNAADIGATWQTLLRDWLPASGLQLDGRPCFEYYGPQHGFDEASGRFSCDIVVPVAPL